MIESWGRGIERVMDACAAATVPAAQLQYEHSGLWITFPFAVEQSGQDSTSESPGKTTQKTPQKTPDMIIEVLKDVHGLLSNRLDKSRETLKEARETIKSLCEPVLEQRELIDYQRYFCGDVANNEDLKLNEGKRVALDKDVAALVRAYANLANEMTAAGYSAEEALAIKDEVEHFSKMRQEIKLTAKDEVDMKQYEPAMRRLIDTYIRAEDS